MGSLYGKRVWMELGTKVYVLSTWIGGKYLLVPFAFRGKKGNKDPALRPKRSYKTGRDQRPAKGKNSIDPVCVCTLHRDHGSISRSLLKLLATGTDNYG